jgi:hypothetical protein
MKKILIAFAICFACMSLSNKAAAQTDTLLQFTKVILYDIAANGTQSITVPAGKIWKIESVSLGSSGSAPAVFLKNSSAQNIAFFASPASTASASFPFWLPAAFTGSLVNNSASYRCSVSITEYTRTP